MTTKLDDGLDIFDFDKTLIRVNSFTVITREFGRHVLRSRKLSPLMHLGRLWSLRRLGILSHCCFKRHVVDLFETSLTELVKVEICQRIFDVNVNPGIMELLRGSKRPVVSTAAPYAYVSRMTFSREVPMITSLDPRDRIPNKENSGTGKLENLKSWFGDSLRIKNLYTDSYEEDYALVAVAETTYLVSEGRVATSITGRGTGTSQHLSRNKTVP